MREDCRVRCFAHILNLCCQDAISAVNDGTLNLDTAEIDSEDSDLESHIRGEKGIVSKVILLIKDIPIVRHLIR